MTRHLAPLALSILLASCAPPHPLQGRWTGTVTPTTPGPVCETTRGTIDIAQDGRLTFAPNQATWLLTGKASPEGSIAAARTTTGADKRPYVTRLDAQATPSGIKGTYNTPRCTAAVEMHPVTPN